MNTNQQGATMKKQTKDDNDQDQLLQLRSRIDEIDNKLVELLNQRIEIIREVGDYKKSINESFFIRSAREADMIKNLALKANKLIPKSTIVNIWRKIITSANVLEQGIKIAVHNPEKISDYQYLIREYYGDFVPLIFHDSTAHIISEIEKNECQIGIFTLPNAGSSESPKNKSNTIDSWWINLANNKSGIKVFAKIPFIGNAQYQLVAVAIKKAEKSNEDKTLLTIEVKNEFSKHQLIEALNEANFTFEILQSVKLDQIQNVYFCLVEIDGFFEEENPQIVDLSKNKIKPFIKIIGHFAKPISA